MITSSAVLCDASHGLLALGPRVLAVDDGVAADAEAGRFMHEQLAAPGLIV